jgi:hypothetical protein
MLGVLLHAPRGPFYSPKAARSRWRPTWKVNLAFYRVVHWTVRCTTGQLLFMSGAWFISILRAANRWSPGSVGAPDTVRCTPDVPNRPLARPHVARRLRGRPLVLATVGSPDSPVHHRTVWWIIAISPRCFSRERRVGRGCLTGQSGAPPDSPVNYSCNRRRFPRSALSPETSLAHQTLSGAPPNSPVCQTELKFGCTEPSPFHFFSPSFVTVSSTYTNTLALKTMY